MPIPKFKKKNDENEEIINEKNEGKFIDMILDKPLVAKTLRKSKKKKDFEDSEDDPNKLRISDLSQQKSKRTSITKKSIEDSFETKNESLIIKNSDTPLIVEHTIIDKVINFAYKKFKFKRKIIDYLF